MIFSGSALCCSSKQASSTCPATSGKPLKEAGSTCSLRWDYHHVDRQHQDQKALASKSIRGNRNSKHIQFNANCVKLSMFIGIYTGRFHFHTFTLLFSHFHNIIANQDMYGPSMVINKDERSDRIKTIIKYFKEMRGRWEIQQTITSKILLHIGCFILSIREGVKKNAYKAVRLTAWVDPQPPPSPEAVRKKWKKFDFDFRL